MNNWSERQERFKKACGQKGRSFLSKRLGVKPESLQRLNAGYDKETKSFTFPEFDSTSQSLE